MTPTASTAAYLGQISASSVTTAFDAGGANLLVVAVGWTDATGGTPEVTFGGHALLPITTPQPTDADGIMALFVLSSPPAGSQPLVIGAATAFLGNVEFNAVGLSGASGTIGQIAGTTTTTTPATLTLTDTASDSILLGFCVSLWNGSQAINASGWSQLATASGTDANGNGFTFSFQAAGGAGAISFTPTPTTGGSQYFAVVVEIEPAASAAPAPVPVTAATSAYLGSLTTGGSVGTAFDVNGGNLLVVAVGYTDPTGNVPTVTYGGVQLTPLLNPKPSSDLGTVVVMILKNPALGPQTLLVSSPSSFIGTTQVGAVAVSSAAGTIGARASVIQRLFAGASITLAGTQADSTLIGFAISDYSEPATMTPPFGWTQQSTATGASGSVFVYTSTVTGGDKVLSVTPPTYAQFFLLGVEVFYESHVVPAIPVTIAASSVTDIGTIGAGTGTVAFNTLGAKMLMVGVAWTNTTPAPTISYGGIPLTLVPDLTIVTPSVGSMGIAVLMNPPSGAQTFSATGRFGYFGPTLVTLVALNGLSGVAGITSQAYVGGHQLDLSLNGSATNSLLLAFAASDFARDEAIVSEGWTTEGEVLSTSSNGWLFSSPGASNAAIELLQASFSQTQVIALELKADIQVTPSITGVCAPRISPLTLRAIGNKQAVPTPASQQYHMYLETFFHNPTWANPQPQDFDLANVPAYIGNLCLSFGIPQCTYVDLTSDIKATVGLNWPGSATLLKETIALLKTRCPSMRVTLCVQQNTAEHINNEAYSPDGWGGMTAAHVENMRKFLVDMNMDGIVIDYECLSDIEDIAHHCATDVNTGAITCYTDTEQLSVIKAIRAGIPRPFVVILDALHVGCYGVAPYKTAAPVSFNGGYNLCVANDPVAVAALDGIHIETYDAGDGYDPRVAIEAFQHFFPNTPLYAGLRVGPPDNGGNKRTMAELTDYLNCVVVRGLAGVFCYALEWDIAQPSGNISANYPDSNTLSYTVAARLGLQQANLPLVSAPRRDNGPSRFWLSS